MNKLVAFLIYSVITIIQVFTCSLFIESAVKRFKKRRIFHVRCESSYIHLAYIRYSRCGYEYVLLKGEKR